MLEKFVIWLLHGLFGVVQGWPANVKADPNTPQTEIAFSGIEELEAALDLLQYPTVKYATPWGVLYNDFVKVNGSWTTNELSILSVLFGDTTLEELAKVYGNMSGACGEWYRALPEMYRLFVEGGVGRFDEPEEIFYDVTH